MFLSCALIYNITPSHIFNFQSLDGSTLFSISTTSTILRYFFIHVRGNKTEKSVSVAKLVERITAWKKLET